MRYDGESPEVAEAIFEQYLPRFAGDVFASNRRLVKCCPLSTKSITSLQHLAVV